MSKKDLFTRQLETFNNQDVKPNAVAETNDTPNAIAEAEPTINSDETRLNYDEFTLPNPNPTTDLKGKRYQKGEPLHTVRYSFQITEELKENLDYYEEYIKRKGETFNQSVFLREALAKALKKEPRG